MFVCLSVCLFVCLFVCVSDSAERARNGPDMRFSPKVAQSIGECTKTLTFQIDIMVRRQINAQWRWVEPKSEKIAYFSRYS